MPKCQRIDQGRWKFRTGCGDAVRQFKKEMVAYFNEGLHVPSEILAECRVWFLSTGLASVVSRRNRMEADLSRGNSDQSQTE